MKNNHKGIRATALFAAGSLAGAGIALLLAPKSGRRTRRDLRKMGQEAVDRTRDFQEDLTNRVGEFADDWRRTARRSLKSGKEIRKNLSHRLEDGKRFMSDKMSHAGDLFRH